MIHKDHVELIKKTINPNQICADFGSGTGAFTLALRDIGGIGTQIYSVDKDKESLDIQLQQFKIDFPQSNVNYINKDFTENLELPMLDGILMANSLHYINAKVEFLINIKKYLKESGKIVIVEYATDKSNYWLPYPISFETFKEIALQSGYLKSELVNSIKLNPIDMYVAQAYLS